MEHLEMELINDVMAYVRENPYSKSGELMGRALWSACTMVSGPSLLAASVHLDYRNARLFERLARITEEPDFNNTAQSRAMDELRELMGYGKTIHSVKLHSGRRIEVYAGQAAFEWRLVDVLGGGKIEYDSEDRRYRNPDLALRDALLHVYGQPREHDRERELLAS